MGASDYCLVGPLVFGVEGRSCCGVVVGRSSAIWVRDDKYFASFGGDALELTWGRRAGRRRAGQDGMGCTLFGDIVRVIGLMPLAIWGSSLVVAHYGCESVDDLVVSCPYPPPPPPHPPVLGVVTDRLPYRDFPASKIPYGAWHFHPYSPSFWTHTQMKAASS